MIKHLIFIIALSLFGSTIFAQSASFNIAIEPFQIPELGGLQSYSFGQSQGKWLLVGGRLDGLHRRQPWASFDEAGHNNQLIVVDPVAMKKWSAPLSSLPASIQEQLSSTNMNFFQEGNNLYCIGGYGYSNTEADHITYPYLTEIKVAEVINAIVNNTSLTPYFHQFSDAQFQVTGGRLKKMNNVFYLMGGHKFMGRYNPMNNPTFSQEYTNQVRRFTLSGEGESLVVHHLNPFTSSSDFHRRDYNAEPQILPNGSQGITMFSGVFQPTIDLPYLNSVTIDSSTYTVNNSFQQYYNHYHCSVVPLYSENANEMHTVFFGGIAQYYDSSGVMVQDNNVPFVKTIARVTRDADNSMAEYKLPIEMPALLGAGSEFIPNESLPRYSNEVIKLDEISGDSTFIGYIFGGINSQEANIFWSNDGTQSIANNQVFKVYLTNNNPLSVHELNKQSTGSLKLIVYQNPYNGNFVAKYHLKDTARVKLTLFGLNGAVLESTVLGNQIIGENRLARNIEDLAKDGVYFINIETPYESATQKIIISK
jgi:hypothetical protein